MTDLYESERLENVFVHADKLVSLDVAIVGEEFRVFRETERFQP